MPHVRRLLASRPQARRGQFRQALRAAVLARTGLPDPEELDDCTPEQAWEEDWGAVLADFTRLPDAWELTEQGLILYEVDCTHRTKMDKFADVVVLADTLYRTLNVALHVYNTAADQTRWWSTHALISYLVDAYEWQDNGAGFNALPMPSDLPCTLRVPGLRVHDLPWEQTFTYYGPDVAVPADIALARGLTVPGGVVRYGETLDIHVYAALLELMPADTAALLPAVALLRHTYAKETT